MVLLVGDPRVIPSPGLRKRLQADIINVLTLDRGDAVVVPTFAAIRGENDPYPPLPIEGVSEADFKHIASTHIESLKSSLPMSIEHWPKKKATLVGLSSIHPPPSVSAPGQPTLTSPVFALFDRSWDPNRGPSNWPLWRKSHVDPRLAEGTEFGGGAGLGLAGGIGGGHEPFKVTDYDLHYAPNVVISKEGQPWCTERFDSNKPACVYQMYLTGAEMWVLPDEWTFTLEAIEKVNRSITWNESDKLKSSVSSRLYTKFHQEACMHYGREFLSMDMWESERASHLRTTCARVLASYGVGMLN